MPEDNKGQASVTIEGVKGPAWLLAVAIFSIVVLSAYLAITDKQ